MRFLCFIGIHRNMRILYAGTDDYGLIHRGYKFQECNLCGRMWDLGAYEIRKSRYTTETDFQETLPTLVFTYPGQEPYVYKPSQRRIFDGIQVVPLSDGSYKAYSSLAHERA